MSYGRVWAGMRWDSYRPEGWWRSWHDAWDDIGRQYNADCHTKAWMPEWLSKALDGSF